jgi:hypothetical protein
MIAVLAFEYLTKDLGIVFGALAVTSACGVFVNLVSCAAVLTGLACNNSGAWQARVRQQVGMFGLG